MKTHLSILLFCVSLLLTTACEKAETPIVLEPTKGDVKNYTLTLGKDYTTQIFFTLSNGNTQGNDFRVWDLGFDSRPDGCFIIINGGKEVQVSNTKSKDFGIEPKLEDAEWRWDNPAGEWRGTAFGMWYDNNKQSLGYVYLIDRGNNEPNRYKKLRILKAEPHGFTIQYANLDGSNEITTFIPRKPGRNYMYYNLNNSSVIHDIEPNFNDWDMLFTRYRHVYYDMDPITPYSVTGVTLNPNKVECAKDSLIGFDNITLQIAKTLPYSRNKDVIGFDWKHYDFNLARFETRSHVTYIIKDARGIFHKMRFIDFYDEQGLKGAPKFEIQRL